MKLKLLFIGLIVTLISMQIGWDRSKERQAIVAAAKPIEPASFVAESAQTDKAITHSKVTEFSPETSVSSTQTDEETDHWFMVEQDEKWSSDELEMVQEVLNNSFEVLERAGLDGEELLDGYRFKRISGEYLDPEEGRIATIDHNSKEIWLSDAAFRVHGFYIYHELGHAVDHRLDRQPSQAYSARTRGEFVESGSGKVWQSGDTFWMRAQGRDNRQEAAADAFALSAIMNEPASRNPIFSGMPANVNYSGIADAIFQSLVEIAPATN